MSQNSIYKLEQNFPVDYLAKQTLEIKEGKIIRTYKNIFREYSKSYNLENIDSNYAKGKRAYDQWENLVWVFAGAAFIFSTITRLIDTNSTINMIVISSLLFLALTFFLLKFKKYDNVYFNDINNNFLFGVRCTTNSEKEKSFIKTFVEEIKKAKNQTD